MAKLTRVRGSVLTPHRASSIADLKLLQTELSDGELVNVDSYYPGKYYEGGGAFYYDATDVTSEDDLGFTIVGYGGKRFKRIDSVGVIVPSMFGCIADGDFVSASGTNTGTDNTVRLQSMINVAHNNGMEVYIPKGNKYLTDTLYLYYDATLNPKWLGRAGRIKISGGTTGHATGALERQGAALLHKPGRTKPLLHLYGRFDINNPTGMGGYVQLTNLNFVGSKETTHVLLLEGSQGFMQLTNYTVKVMNKTENGFGITENTTWETIHDNGLIRGTANGLGDHYCSGLNLQADGTLGQVNMKIYRNVDVYRCGYNFRIGRRKAAQGTFGPLVFEGGQGSHADQISAWLDGGVIAFTAIGWQHEGAQKTAIRIDRTLEDGTRSTDIGRSIKILSSYITGCGLVEDGGIDSYAVYVGESDGVLIENLVLNNCGNGLATDVGKASNITYKNITFRTMRPYGTSSGYGFRAFGTQEASARIALESVTFNQNPAFQFETVMNTVFSRAMAGGVLTHRAGTAPSLSMGAQTGLHPASILNFNLQAATTLTDILCSKPYHRYLVTTSNTLLTIPNNRSKFRLNGSDFVPTSSASVIELYFDGTYHIELTRSPN